MVVKQDEMLKKQDETKEEIKHGFSMVSSKIDRTNELLEKKICKNGRGYREL